MKKINILFVLLGLVCTVTAQDLRADLKQMVTKLKETEGVSLVYSVKGVRNLADASTEVVHVEEGFVKSYQGNSLVKINQIWSLKTSRLLVIVDEQMKSIRVVEATKDDERYLKELLDPEQFDVKEERQFKPVFKGVKNALKHYEVENVSLQIKKAEYLLDTKTGFLSKLIYHYKDELSSTVNTVEISYSNVQFDFKPSSKLFEASQFITRKKDGSYKPSATYSTYHIIQNEDEE